jgi:hypothetical protein
MSWQYTDESETIVSHTFPDGTCQSGRVENQFVQDYLAGGGVIEPAFTLAELKNKKIATINGECMSRIILKWPLGLQSSINMGLYPALVDQCKADIAATIDASNTQGRDVVNACASIAAVQAVTINWPVI